RKRGRAAALIARASYSLRGGERRFDRVVLAVGDARHDAVEARRERREARDGEAARLRARRIGALHAPVVRQEVDGLVLRSLAGDPVAAGAGSVGEESERRIAADTWRRERDRRADIAAVAEDVAARDRAGLAVHGDARRVQFTR